MAIESNTEEFQRSAAELLRTVEAGLPLSREQVQLLKNQNEINAKLNASLGKASKGVQDFASAAYDGKLGMSQLASGFDVLTSSMSFLVTIMPPLRGLKFLLGGLTAVATLFGKALKVSGEQADILLKAYQELGKTGQNAAGGMGDVARQLVQLGYGIKEIDQMTALLKENSQSLASFGGTAVSGGKAFADAADQIKKSDIGDTLLKLGRTPDDINRGIAMFIKHQQGLGIQNTQINKNLAEQSAKYVMQLDLMSRLTGQSAEQIQEKLDQANAEEAYNQVQYELEQKALAGDEAARKQLEENKKIASTLTGETLKEFQRGVGGDLAAMQKTLMTAPGAVALLGQKAYTAAEYFDALGKGAKQVREAYGQTGKMNANEHLLPMSERARAESGFADQKAQQKEAEAKAEQERIKNNLEPNTKKMLLDQAQQRETRDNIQDFVRLGIGPATTALNLFTDAANAASKALPGTGTSRAAPGGGGATSGSGATSGGATGAVGKGTDFGLKLKPGAENNGASTDTLYGVAAKVHKLLGGDYRYFSGLNDRSSKDSSHSQGRAFDLVLNDPNRYASVLAQIQSMDQVKLAQFEPLGHRNSNGSVSTGDHIHAEVSARNGFKGMLSGPAGGYRPNIEMHGREQLTITPTDPGKRNSFEGSESTVLMTKQLDKMDQMIRSFNDRTNQDAMNMQLGKLDQLIRVMSDQVNISQKILQASR